MMEDNSLVGLTHAGQLVVSKELALLLRWLMEHNSEGIKKIIKKALAQGAAHDIMSYSIQAETALTQEACQEINQQIGDFFIILEALLHESLDEHIKQHAKSKDLHSTIEHLDVGHYAHSAVHTSIERVSKKVTENPSINPKEQLFEELLKHWKPYTKEMN